MWDERVISTEITIQGGWNVLELNDWAEEQMSAYEARRGRFSGPTRFALLEAARKGGALMGERRHPIGVGAELGTDHRTAANRSAVAVVLREYYAGTLERGKLNKPVERSESQTGADLADRMTSRLEVASALDRLRHGHRYLWLVIGRRFRDDLSVDDIAERWRRSNKAITCDIRDALNLLIEWMFIDVL